MIAVVDYGVGNLFSLARSFERIGEQAVVTGDKKVIERAERVVLPGVGAFADARQKLKDAGMDEVLGEVARSGKPLLGICLGMQMLFERSREYGVHPGLGFLLGSVVPIAGLIPSGLKIPHIGWNALIFKRESKLLSGVPEGSHVYFVHSFCAVGCEESLVAAAEYGAELTAIVQKDNVFGCQFHPEKSGPVGLKILKNFCEVAP